MFSEAVLDHFRAPRNVGKLDDASASVEVTNPVCGDVLHLAAKVENGRITSARFLCQGCTTAIACASLLTVELTGKNILEARTLTAEYLSEKLEKLPEATWHAAQLAADASRALLDKLRPA